MARLLWGQWLEHTADRIKRPPNALFQGLFEALIRFHNGRGGISQTMTLACLMIDTREDMGHGQDNGPFIITHYATQRIP